MATRQSAQKPDSALVELLRNELHDPPVDTLAHWVWWSADAWRSADVGGTDTHDRIESLATSLGYPKGAKGGWIKIARRDVFDQRDDPNMLFLASMAWGFGTTGYGWKRTSRIIGTGKVATAVAELRRAAEAAPSDTWRAWSPGGKAKINGLGTAFASKVAYFAAYDPDAGRGPLIADLNTAWSLWALTGVWDSRSNPTRYAEYVTWAEHTANEMGLKSHDIERALFRLGPSIRLAAK